MKSDHELATFGMGCFWCGQASFSRMKGVVSTRVGYMGGAKEDPTYEEVCNGQTGHIEVVEVQFEVDWLSFQELLETFWGSHNPTGTIGGNGDSGDQYRSSIFYHSDSQKAQAEESKRRIQASGRFRGRVSTTILPASRFWVAEDHHQCYLSKLENGGRL